MQWIQIQIQEHIQMQMQIQIQIQIEIQIQIHIQRQTQIQIQIQIQMQICRAYISSRPVVSAAMWAAADASSVSASQPSASGNTAGAF